MEHTRRDFLKNAGIVAAGIGAVAGVGSLAGCAAPAAGGGAAGAEAKHECDVVIAGAGIGGLAAAVSAAESGASVILVEASGKVGGTSRFAAGALGLFNDNWDEVIKARPLSDPVLGKVVVDNWPSYLEWIGELGLTTDELTSSYVWMGGQRPAEQGSKAYTDEYLQQFGEIFTEKGGTTLTSTRAVKLVTDDDGAVAGLVAEDAEGTFVIKAKSVILATGGWQCDKEMCTKYLGRHADLSQAQCVPYLTGSGIKMGVEVGAQLSRSFGSFYGHPQPWPSAPYLKGIDTVEGYEALDNVDECNILYYGTTTQSIQSLGVFVNTDGHRFVDEGLASDAVNQEIMQQYMARAYWIVDQGIRDALQSSTQRTVIAGIIGGDRIDHMIEMGFPVVQADTLEELGQKIVTDTADGTAFRPANMLKTIEDYNAQVSAGTAATMEIPHTGRTPATPIATGPFWAIPVTSGIMATFGGLKINEDTQVIGTDDKPIAGLYAVPGCAGGIMNGQFWCVMSGYSVFGRISGEKSTEFAKAAAEK